MSYLNTVPFRIYKDSVYNNSQINKASIGQLSSAGHETSSSSINSKTILITDTIECDGGILLPNSITPFANVVLLDENSGTTVLMTGSIPNQSIVLDKNLSTGAFGQIVFTSGSPPSELIFDAGERNDVVFNRSISGYINNNSVMSPITPSSSINIKYTYPASITDNRSSIIKWYKISNSSVYIECITASIGSPFSLVPK